MEKKNENHKNVTIKEILTQNDMKRNINIITTKFIYKK